MMRSLYTSADMEEDQVPKSKPKKFWQLLNIFEDEGHLTS